jgi:hypothetical protein
MSLEAISRITPEKIYWYRIREQLHNHLRARTRTAIQSGIEARAGIKNVRQLRARQRWVRQEFINSIGGMIDYHGPLKSRTVDTIKCDGFSIEKIIFESRPKNFVTANLYVPDRRRSKGGAVLFLCGHYLRAKTEPEYQEVCQRLVRSGLIVLAQDPIGQGERLSYYEKAAGDNTVLSACYEHDYTGSRCLLLGDSLAKYFLHDAMRSIDYLVSRDEVDPKRIGVCGNSGGGTQTTMMMMADERIAAAAPTTFIMNRESFFEVGGVQCAEQISPGMVAAGWDHEDILLAMAPKPVLVMAVTWDFFPIEAARQTVSLARRYWRMLKAEDNFRYMEDDSRHKFTAKMAQTAAEFFALHLNNEKIPRKATQIEAMEPSMLWCTQSGQVRGELESARFVHDDNVQRLRLLEAGRKRMSAVHRQSRAYNWFKDRVLGSRVECEPNVRIYYCEQHDGLLVENCLWRSQPDLFGHGCLLRDAALAGEKLPVIIAAWEGGTAQMHAHDEWIRNACKSGNAVFVVDLSGSGAIEPHQTSELLSNHDFYGAMHGTACDMLWLGDSIAALRTYELIGCVWAAREIKTVDAGNISMYASGRYALYALIAALLEKRVFRLELESAVPSMAGIVNSLHYDSCDIQNYIIPGMLQYCDLPEIKSWLRKRKCNVVQS